jgi:hypothetical protein
VKGIFKLRRLKVLLQISRFRLTARPCQDTLVLHSRYSSRSYEHPLRFVFES